MVTINKGAGLEELVRAYFARQGFFALRGVSFRYEGEEVTDVDVWLYGRQTASVRTRAIVDVKDKRTPKAFERILWTRGMQLALGVDRAIVATTETSPKVISFAQQQKVALLSKGFLERLSKSLDTSARMSSEEFIACISQYSDHKQDGDWLRAVSKAKSAVISLSGYPAFNRAISSFRFFAERIETRRHHREQALRGAYLCAAIACIALDSALERSQYEDQSTKHNTIVDGITYGNSGDSRVQNSINDVLELIATGMDNGRAVSRQVEASIRSTFAGIRADIIAELFSREQYASSLFSVAKELDDCAHASDSSRITDISLEAKTVLGVFADFTKSNRSSLFSGQPMSFHGGTDSPQSIEQVETGFVIDKPPGKLL